MFLGLQVASIGRPKDHQGRQRAEVVAAVCFVEWFTAEASFVGLALQDESLDALTQLGGENIQQFRDGYDCVGASAVDFP